MRARIASFSATAFAVSFLPVIASAQQTLTWVMGLVANLLNMAIGLFVTIAIVVFFWGLIKYLFNQDSENAAEGIKIMFWGLIALFVMVSIWGIIRLLQNTFQVGGNQPFVPTAVPISGAPGTIGVTINP